MTFCATETFFLFFFDFLYFVHDLFHVFFKHQNLLVNFDLVPKIRDHDLELSISIIKESLVILDLLIYKKVLLVKGLQAMNTSDKFPAIISDFLLLVITGIILKLLQKLHRLLKLFL